MHRPEDSGRRQSIDHWLGFFGAMAAVLTVASLLIPQGRQFNVATTIFLLAAGMLLGATNIRIDLGVISLGAIAYQAAAAILSPLEAALVGIAATIPRAYQRRNLDRVPYAAVGAFYGAFGAAFRLILERFGAPTPLAIVAAVLMTVVANLVSTGLIGTRIANTTVVSVWRRALTRMVWVAYVFFVAASLLLVDLLSHGWAGYAEAATLVALTLPFVYTIFGRRWLHILEGQLSEADRLAAYGQSIELALHGLRNNIATAVAALDAMPKSHRSADHAVAMMALADAGALISQITAMPRGDEGFSMVELDLSDIARQTVAVTRYRAHSVGTTLGLREHPTTLLVIGHALLLREAANNLVLNAIEAVPGGRVQVETGRRSDNWAFLRVIDSGRGLSEEQRRRLFEPHATTKGAGGMGVGLFVASGIARQHMGRLYYEGGRRRGGVFTIALPPIERSRSRLKRG